MNITEEKGKKTSSKGDTKKEKQLNEFVPKIIAFSCNWCSSAFFFEAKFSAGSGSQRKTWGKKKLALTCSNFAFNGRWETD